MLLKRSQLFCGKRTLVLTAILGIFVSCPLMAGTILIQFGDLDIAYDGTDIFDADPGAADPDPVSNTSITADGIEVATFPTGVTADLFIPDVLDIAVGPGGSTVFSAVGGVLDLDFGGGEFLDLDLDSVAVIYVDAVVFQFVFGATVATVAGQTLPAGLVIGDPVSVSFETTVDPGSLTDAGGFLTGFSAVGTGTISGELVIPEPATMALALFGLFAMSLGTFAAKESR